MNLGDDTDTTGAVAGGLAGIIYGLYSDFAKQCMMILRNKELIEKGNDYEGYHRMQLPAGLCRRCTKQGGHKSPSHISE